MPYSATYLGIGKSLDTVLSDLTAIVLALILALFLNEDIAVAIKSKVSNPSLNK